MQSIENQYSKKLHQVGAELETEKLHQAGGEFPSIPLVFCSLIRIFAHMNRQTKIYVSSCSTSDGTYWENSRTQANWAFLLDRIADVKVEEEKFTIDENFDAANYFCDSYGIVVDNSLEVQHIVLRAYGAERYYLRDLPIHHSQRVINTTDEYTDFEMKLRPTADFKAHLLSRGQWVEILEPQSLADEIIEWHQKAIDRYKKIDFFYVNRE